MSSISTSEFLALLRPGRVTVDRLRALFDATAKMLFNDIKPYAVGYVIAHQNALVEPAVVEGWTSFGDVADSSLNKLNEIIKSNFLNDPMMKKPVNPSDAGIARYSSVVVQDMSKLFGTNVGFVWALVEKTKIADADISLSNLSEFVEIQLFNSVKITLQQAAHSKQTFDRYDDEYFIRLFLDEINVYVRNDFSNAWILDKNNVLRSLVKPNLHMRMGEGIAGTVAKTGSFEVISDMLTTSPGSIKPYHPKVLTKENLSSGIFWPIGNGENTIGVVAAYFARPHAPSELDLEYFEALGRHYEAYFALINDVKHIMWSYNKSLEYAPITARAKQAQADLHDLSNIMIKIESEIELAEGILHNRSDDVLGELANLHSKATKILKQTRKLSQPISNNDQDEPQGKRNVYTSKVNLLTAIRQWNQESDEMFKDVKIDRTITGQDSCFTRIELLDLERILDNLASNSIKAVLLKGKRTLTIAVFAEPGVVGFRFSDNGRGMDDEAQANFDKLYWTQDRERGMGLGMTIVKQLLEKYKGNLHFTSTWGMGTSFVVRFPSA